MSETVDVAVADQEWRTYDEFASGIDTYRLPNVNLDGASLSLSCADQSVLQLRFGASDVSWQWGSESGTDPYDAVQIRPDVTFVNLPLISHERLSITVVFSSTTHRAIIVRSQIAAEASAATPQVQQDFWAATTDGGSVSGDAPGPSRDLIGKRNVYRYSPDHLYEHVYISSQRYAWQCLEGVQRGHGDMDLSTVWKFDDGLYLFCFREFRIAVASVWIHDLSYQLRTTGIFLGLTGDGEAAHSRGGGHIYPLGSVAYPDVQPV